MPKTILLADDSSTIRKIVELTFDETEMRVETVASGADAMKRWEELRPDLVLADVVMPAPSGYELCRQVKDSEHPVPVLLLSSTFEPFDEELARECGADGHLVKPFESGTLRERVRELLATPSEEGEPREPDDTAVREAEQAVEEFAVEHAETEEAGAAPALVDELDEQLVEAVSRAVVRRLSEEAIREIAREVVPDLAERIIRERIRQLETED